MTNRPKLHAIERLGLLLTAVAAVIALVTAGSEMALGIAVGGALGLLNFYALRRLMAALLQAKHPPRQVVLSLLLLAKFGALGVAVYLILTYLPVDPTALLVGVSVVVLSIFVEGIRAALAGGASSAPEVEGVEAE